MNGPIRVLQVVAKMNLAGTESMLMNYYRHVDREKVQFDFAVCTEEKCDFEDEIRALGGRIIRYPRYRGVNHFAYCRWWNAFFSGHREYRIVHGHIGSTAAIYLSAAKKHGCLAIAHSHGTKEPLNLHSLLYGIYSYPTRYIADCFFGCSMQALEDRYGTDIAHDARRARVLNNAIEPARYAFSEETRKSRRRELGIDEQAFVIGTVGRLTLQKNPAETVRILAELKRRGVKFRFLWTGVGEMRQEIEEKLAESGLSDSVMMLGTRTDVPELLQAMDVFILPSLWEGLGIVAVEAQAAGLPTLVSDAVPREASVTELCRFLPLGDASVWADAVISSRGRKRTVTTEEIRRAHYDIAESAKWLEDFYLRQTLEIQKETA